MSNNRQRGVEGNIVFSTYMPSIRIKVDDAFRYVGNQQFTTEYEATVDLYLFVETQRQLVKRFVFVHFEELLASSECVYEYPDTDSVLLGSYNYIDHNGSLNIEEYLIDEPESDGGRIIAFLREQGYVLEGDFVFQRFARVVDEEAHNEISINYLENANATGLSTAQWEIIAHELHERALKSFDIVDNHCGEAE